MLLQQQQQRTWRKCSWTKSNYNYLRSCSFTFQNLHTYVVFVIIFFALEIHDENKMRFHRDLSIYILIAKWSVSQFGRSKYSQNDATSTVLPHSLLAPSPMHYSNIFFAFKEERDSLNCTACFHANAGHHSKSCQNRCAAVDIKSQWNRIQRAMLALHIYIYIYNILFAVSDATIFYRPMLRSCPPEAPYFNKLLFVNFVLLLPTNWCTF